MDEVRGQDPVEKSVTVLPLDGGGVRRATSTPSSLVAVAAAGAAAGKVLIGSPESAVYALPTAVRDFIHVVPKLPFKMSRVLVKSGGTKVWIVNRRKDLVVKVLTSPLSDMGSEVVVEASTNQYYLKKSQDRTAEDLIRRLELPLPGQYVCTSLQAAISSSVGRSCYHDHAHVVRASEFLHEALLSIGLTRELVDGGHTPHVVRVTEAFINSSNDRGYLVMERIKCTLRDALKDDCGVRLSPRAVAGMYLQIIHGLAVAQRECSLKHHDLHDRNVFIKALKRDVDNTGRLSKRAKRSTRGLGGGSRSSGKSSGKSSGRGGAAGGRGGRRAPSPKRPNPSTRFNMWKGLDMETAEYFKYVVGPFTFYVENCGFIPVLGDFGLSSGTIKQVALARIDLELQGGTQDESSAGGYASSAVSQSSYSSNSSKSSEASSDARSGATTPRTTTTSGGSSSSGSSAVSSTQAKDDEWGEWTPDLQGRRGYDMQVLFGDDHFDHSPRLSQCKPLNELATRLRNITCNGLITFSAVGRPLVVTDVPPDCLLATVFAHPSSPLYDFLTPPPPGARIMDMGAVPDIQPFELDLAAQPFTKPAVPALSWSNKS
jgi:hypothetical protein